MARLGLKLFYLRSRERQLSQQAVARDMGIRQATVSNIEQGVSLPSAPLLVELCRYFDVTPTYLLDDERGVEPRPSERWSLRDSLVTVGMWVEAPADAVETTDGGRLLVPLQPGGAFYDEDALAARRDGGVGSAAQARSRAESELERQLEEELTRHPQRRRKGGT